MSYTLQAIIGAREVFEKWRNEGLAHVELTDMLTMIPLTAALRTRFDIPRLPLTDEGEQPVLPDSLNSLCKELSRAGLVAYVEAEFFGGAGSQAHVLFSQGTMIAGPVVAERAINQALRQLSVHSESNMDEFDAVGLGRHRHTDAWVTNGR